MLSILKAKLEILVISFAETDLYELENKEEVIELMREIENSPLMFFAHATKIEFGSISALQETTPGNAYKFFFKNKNLIFYKPDQSDELYLISII